MNPRHVLSSALLAALLLTGCASPNSPTAGASKEDADDDTASYVPTGSHISQRVKKKQTKASAEKNEHDQQLLQEMQQKQPDPAGPMNP